ncbi:MAG: hypothetical protein A2499_08540 [Stygiobacter sp. RIFOXYC12_FULL_38_8]|nr:MAG: hypothetical protein A2X62_02840 [Stygiobacter sp. GWC2_38_9]OGV06497.1 MAG: hypothetical protein A2299_02210 [Stygiobacter sp. RIFOXYB2_FULL_37_11]OGV10561.1 MAG: hypothetical protein A2237_18685 [Stygiobacter sp. RIFOXYA2_FULL_38_8]OGV13242.1 MAG: hypothetical protein A2440_13010 [Stygiobacter sp. RIFOXYC2_FULL_38_25]OGV25761.1 MAG: hypothetical protein A2499_08540 [Stygiobacter sp. RIFOXYC12_FULL_38_8]OGV83288.1 MAG: hypothetical protein A2X65_16565 [Stygiobacter sp. GWF2_38_21]
MRNLKSRLEVIESKLQNVLSESKLIMVTDIIDQKDKDGRVHVVHREIHQTIFSKDGNVFESKIIESGDVDLWETVD